MNSISYLANEQEIQYLKTEYAGYEKVVANPYVDVCFKTDLKTITIYKSKKVVIQSKEEIVINTDFEIHAGSDESGAGDYFGPLTVCACIIDFAVKDSVLSLGVKDSKQLSDEKIKQIAPQLMQKIPYALIVLDNQTYNTKNQSYNLNALKALLHNFVYLKLQKTTTLPKRKIVDQFCSEKNYYQYLKGQEIVKVEMYEKAENRFLAVACSSIIARFAFLESMEKLNMQFNTKFPFGAGKMVDHFGKELVEKHGEEVLWFVAKKHFATTQKILKSIEE